MPREPISIRELLGGALPGALARRLPAPELLAAWREAAGRAIARRALPVALEQGGVLVVAVSGSAWLQELSLAGPQLCARLQEAGFDVARLKLVKAPTPPPPKPPAPPLPELGPEEEAELAAGLAHISDPELRAALTALGRASLRARKAPGK
ncbi:MAG: DUF721 domain-containing protein [Desulfarculaceae bacterium]|nr:DUF721 domain-containing protein [Desulfarculaceae bacterium]MCF8071216.1 DUF721 domain-containing protein [Desulfarculaceae bacterium]MCF8101181.1 DUF721 domain-containing protein [Desulfarculaceae bacterium]MCF8115270.1 DUF721 domain-containing protein [Desulfarculaceae bacterium]